MKQTQIALLALAAWLLLAVSGAASAQTSQPLRRVVELKASDGTPLKASYFAADKPGPSVLLLHQVNRDRKSWEGVAAQLAAVGINTLTLDMRGIGESGGVRWEKLTDAELNKHWRGWPEDMDVTLAFLRSQPDYPRTNCVGTQLGLGREARWVRGIANASGLHIGKYCAEPA